MEVTDYETKHPDAEYLLLSVSNRWRVFARTTTFSVGIIAR